MQDAHLWDDVEQLTARRVLQAALECFATHGYHATTTREIAQRGGISTGGVYVHYASKTEILFAIVRAATHSSLHVVEDALARAEGDHAARMRALIGALVRWHVDHQGLARVVAYEQGALPEKHRVTLRPLRRRFFEIFEGELEAGQAAGEFSVPDPTTSARALLSLCTDIARWYRADRGPGADELATAYADMAIRLVAAK